MPLSGSKYGFTFAQSVDASESGSLERKVRQDLKINRVEVIVYGSEALLKVRPVISDRKGNLHEIVESIGKSYIDGNHDSFDFVTDVEIERGETIEIQYENFDTQYEHNFRVNMNVETAGGFSLW